MARKKRKVLRPGENSYTSPVTRVKKGPWELVEVSITTTEPCEVCTKDMRRVFSVVNPEEFDEKRVCEPCAKGLNIDVEGVTVTGEGTVPETDEDLTVMAISDERFDELWRNGDWRTTITPGNVQRTVARIYVLVCRFKGGPSVGRWGYRLAEKWGRNTYTTKLEAQEGARLAARKQHGINRLRAARRRRGRDLDAAIERPWENGEPYGEPQPTTPLRLPSELGDVATWMAGMVGGVMPPGVARPRYRPEEEEEEESE
jgi:hypothetical protein